MSRKNKLRKLKNQLDRVLKQSWAQERAAAADRADAAFRRDVERWHARWGEAVEWDGVGTSN